jgi:hypothetical protein
MVLDRTLFGISSSAIYPDLAIGEVVLEALVSLLDKGLLVLIEGGEVSFLRHVVLRDNGSLADRQIWVDRRAADSKERAIKNKEFAAEIRARWLTGFKWDGLTISFEFLGSNSL